MGKLLVTTEVYGNKKMSKLHNFLMVIWMNPDYLEKEDMDACRQLNFTSLSLPYLPRIGDILELSCQVNKKNESGELQEGFVYRVIAVVYIYQGKPKTQGKKSDWELHLIPVI